MNILKRQDKENRNSNVCRMEETVTVLAPAASCVSCLVSARVDLWDVRLAANRLSRGQVTDQRPIDWRWGNSISKGRNLPISISGCVTLRLRHTRVASASEEQSPRKSDWSDRKRRVSSGKVAISFDTALVCTAPDRYQRTMTLDNRRNTALGMRELRTSNGIHRWRSSPNESGCDCGGTWKGGGGETPTTRTQPYKWYSHGQYLTCQWRELETIAAESDEG